MKDKIKGKIVVYNAPWTSYGGSVDYRVNGAWRASQYGASAALVRSVTPDSI
jgi:carboxypeptidase Q